MSDRLSELLRQRALLHEHLAWLDREIASTERSAAPANAPIITRSVPLLIVPLSGPSALGGVGGASIPSAPLITARAESPVSAASSAESVVVPGAEAILDKYRVETGSVQTDVRKGCFVYFAAAFVALALGVALLYFAISSR